MSAMFSIQEIARQLRGACKRHEGGGSPCYVPLPTLQSR